MSRERFGNQFQRWAGKGLRAGIASSLLFATDSAPHVQLAAFNQFTGSRTAVARALASQESQATPLTAEAIRQLTAAFSSRERGRISQMLHPTENLTWGIYGSLGSGTDRSKDEVLNMFVQSLGRNGVPQCIGFRWQGAALEVYFDKLAVAPFRFMSGSSLVVLLSDRQANMRIAIVEEIESGDIAKAKQGLSPCQTNTPLPKPEALPAKNQLEPSLAKQKIVFVAWNDNAGTRDLYMSNLDGSELKRLTSDGKTKMYVKWLDARTIVYSLLEEGNKGLFTMDVETGVTNQITRTDASDVAASLAGKEVVFSRRNGPGEQDLYVVERDGKNLRQVTSDSIGNSEDYPIISPDGSLVAYLIHAPGQHGRPLGTVIAEWSSLEEKFSPDYAPFFIKGGNPIAWSPDGQNLLIVKHKNIGQRVVGVAYLTDRNGKNEKKLIEGFLTGSWSPDGKYIIASLQPAGGGDAQPYLVPVDGGKKIELFKVKGFVEFVDWQPAKPEQVKPPEKEARRKVVLVPGLVQEIKNGQLTSGAFDELMVELVYQHRYDILKDIYLFSLGGWKNENGRLPLRDQDCFETLKGQDYAAGLLLEYWQEVQKLDPDARLTTIGHSWGNVVILRALELGQNKKYDINWQGMEVRFVQGPLLGQSKTGLSQLAALVTPDLPPGCVNILGAPSPGVGSYKTITEMLDMWDDPSRIEQLRNLGELLAKKGIGIQALASLGDCVISPSSCVLDSDKRELLIMLGRRLPILTQEWPGGTIWRDYPISPYLGHRAFLSGEGLKDLLSTIPTQIR